MFNNSTDTSHFEADDVLNDNALAVSYFWEFVGTSDTSERTMLSMKNGVKPKILIK